MAFGKLSIFMQKFMLKKVECYEEIKFKMDFLSSKSHKAVRKGKGVILRAQ